MHQNMKYKTQRNHQMCFKDKNIRFNKFLCLELFSVEQMYMYEYGNICTYACLKEICFLIFQKRMQNKIIISQKNKHLRK